MSVQQIREQFVARFGAEPTLVGVAPGRVNLIGEHTDYNDGFVFPAAIDRVTFIAATVTDGQTELHSEQTGPAQGFDVNQVEPGQLEGWGIYPAGMGWALRKTGKTLPNIQAVVSSDIPMGSGVSSSAALELAFGVVWNELASLDLSNTDLAKYGKVCENQFVGVNSGIMDQMACALGKDGQAMFLDTRSLEIQYAPIPPGLAVVLCDTKKPRALTDSAYNERRSQCEEAARILGVRALRDATIDGLEPAKGQMSEVVYRRARHVITENDRCVRFAEALRQGDTALAGQLMQGSHESLRDDYEVSCRELDAMAEAAWAAPGCVGARMTGAGFGGACVALVQKDQLEVFIEATLTPYEAATGLAGEAMACEIVEGARLLGR
jgi:galactokinase